MFEIMKNKMNLNLGNNENEGLAYNWWKTHGVIIKNPKNCNQNVFS